MFIKKYDQIHVFEKVALIHEELEKIQFPHIIPLKKSNEPYSLVQGWQKNSYSADFAKAKHRRKAVKILKELHETNHLIEWSRYSVIPKLNLIQKWNARLERFLLQENELVKYLRHHFYDIVLYANKALKKIRQKPGPTPNRLSLLHGDVVHHNFLITKNGMKLIDFDLAVVGDAAEEMILWMHRALPNMDYDIETLLQENKYLREICLPKLHYLQYPNELLREWQYVLYLGDHEKDAFLEYIMPFTENALRHWPEFIATTEKIQEMFEVG
ncbi:MAG: phosphotransferase [Bacilli bacterium]|uniref:Phosphotransferase family protein n=1 Tax=Ureibacillus suwonensis TaxID=313007 RepID=A0ABW0REA7_9BACL